ncbi:hypothetical protein [Glycomyces sp. NRRL B-16210]|uniref:hypothetical protein n=1 Tax=Glycomyces sp. NRRL B-16210 TaxID=1463821 RepID=UPI00055680F4|nr:hypothetical protein [Glycomyces sp. NRRL B-16210]
MAVSDDERSVELEEDFSVLPDQTSDDTDRGWGEALAPTPPARGKGRAALSARDLDLLAERPPHWS